MKLGLLTRRTWLAVIAIFLIFGCADMASNQRGQMLDAALGSAGFRPVPETNPLGEQLATVALANLDPLAFYPIQSTHNEKLVYVVSDPYDCGCVFVGSEPAFQRYQAANLAAGGTGSKIAVNRQPELQPSLEYALGLAGPD